MKTARFTLESISDLMFGKWSPEKKRSEETHDQFELRNWQSKLHLTTDGQLFIQPFALKNALASAARWLAMPIPGEGKKTYTKRFMAGVIVVDKMLLNNGSGKPANVDSVDPLSLFVPSGGQPAGGKRVVRIFPTLHQWTCAGSAIVFDEKIDDKVFRKHLETVGQFIGFGSMRVENGGINGRFEVKEFDFR